MGIGPKIKKAREEMHLTQKELAEAVGVTSSAITNYETGISHPKEPILYKLMTTLNKDANYFFSDYFERKNNPATGDGDGLNERERAVALAYRAASDDDKAVVDAALRKYMELQPKYISETAI